MRAPLLSRRTMLRGAGAVIALPWLDAMLPRGIASRAMAAAAQSVDATQVTRVAFLFFPNGANMAVWSPTADAVGRWIASPTLRELAPFQEEISVYTGLRHQFAEGNGDGPGDHARSAACFLTGVQPKKTAGDDIRVGRSIDQEIADDQFARGMSTRLRSLELGSEPAMTSGNCDSGYSCAYSANISWKSEQLPNGKETDPRAAFDRVFGRRDSTPEETASRARSRRSILEGTVEQAKHLARVVGAEDRARLDEYLEGVRELERRLENDASAQLDASDIIPQFDGGPLDAASRIDLLGEVLALAFKTDSTRVATLMFANEGSNRAYKEIGVSDGHHDISHHGNDPKKLEQFAAINRFQVARLAAFLRALARTKEHGRPLLDSTLVLYGGAIADGNRHNHDDLPILLAGGRARGVRGGRLVACTPGTPLCDLHLGIARAAGATLASFGDAKSLIEV